MVCNAMLCKYNTNIDNIIIFMCYIINLFSYPTSLLFELITSIVTKFKEVHAYIFIFHAY